MSERKQLLDPLSTMCKLIALNFSETNTKLSIQHHVLTLQKPNGYQFLIRLYNGDGRENISELYYAVVRLIEWYLVPQYRTENKNNFSEQDYDSEDSPKSNASESSNAKAIEISYSPELKKMVGYLCESFRKLQRTYNYGNVVLTLQFYINLLEDGLKGNYDKSKLPSYIVEKEKETENLLDYNKLKNIWDIKRLKQICEQYDRCFASQDESGSHLMIDAYLMSINAILETADTEFINLIKNSNSG